MRLLESKATSSEILILTLIVPTLSETPLDFMAFKLFFSGVDLVR